MPVADTLSRETVVVLHGFGASPRWMLLLCRRIAGTGRQVVNWGYPSWRRSIRCHARRLLTTVSELSDDPAVERIHFIAYSMGSIICRTALLDDPRRGKLGRVVMLGPPNRGSHVATFFAPWVGKFIPAVRELSSQPHSFVNGLPRLRNVEVGVIAAGRDRIVGAESTHLPCQRDHLVVHCGHLPLVFSREVSRRALLFLETGSFAAEVKQPADGSVAGPSVNVSPLGAALPFEQA